MQLYFDSIPCGIPIGYDNWSQELMYQFVIPGTNKSDPEGFENDKTLRNLGYLKGPISCQAPNKLYWPANTLRHSPRSLRRILGTYSFEKTKKHALTAVNLGYFNINESSAKSRLQLDYIEFCPVSLIDTEGID